MACTSVRSFHVCACFLSLVDSYFTMSLVSVCCFVFQRGSGFITITRLICCTAFDITCSSACSYCCPLKQKTFPQIEISSGLWSIFFVCWVVVNVLVRFNGAVEVLFWFSFTWLVEILECRNCSFFYFCSIYTCMCKTM